MPFFDTTSITAIALGIGSAAALFALHRLRVQPSSKTIATLLFWRQAIQEQQSRVLTGRFAHPLTFLLLLAIAVLLALTLVGDRWRSAATRDPAVIVIDTGYAMEAIDAQQQTRLDTAVHRATDDIARYGEVSLISAGEQTRLLASASDPQALLDYHLSQLRPGNTPSDSVSALQLAFSLLPKERGQVIWYTDRQSVPIELPAEIANRVHLRHVDAKGSDVTITGVIYEPDAAGPAKGRLRVRLGFTSDVTQAVTLKASSAQGDVRTITVSPTAESDATIDNVPADGAAWTLQLVDAPGIGTNDTVVVQLPRRPLLAFRFHSLAPEPIRAALLAIGSEVKDDASPAIDVVTDNTASPTGSKSVLRLLTSGNAQVRSGDRIDFASGSARTLSDIEPEASVVGPGPAITDKDIVPVLHAGDAVVAAFTKAGPSAELRLSSALWNVGSDLPKKAAFPVLLQRLGRQLAGWSETASIDAERALADPLWSDNNDVRPTLVYARPEEPRTATTPAADSVPPAPTGRPFPVLDVILTAALTLLVFEGLLFAARKIV